MYDLRVVFNQLHQYNIKVNPLNFTFGMTSKKKLLEFLLCHHEIKIDPNIANVIIDMPLPRIHTQLPSFQSYVEFLMYFISNLSSRFQPILGLIKKDFEFKQDEHYQCTFKEIKYYLINPLVLIAHIQGSHYSIMLILLISQLEICQLRPIKKKRRMHYII